MCSIRWREVAYPRTPTYREVRPPLPVTINLDQAIARDNPPLRSVNPLWVTAYSIKLTGYCPGMLHAWLRLGTGVWLAECSCIVHSPNNDTRHDLRQWMPASAITPQHHHRRSAHRRRKINEQSSETVTDWQQRHE